jgi:hypothetical protein
LGACRVYIPFHKKYLGAAPRATLPQWGTLRPLAQQVGPIEFYLNQIEILHHCNTKNAKSIRMPMDFAFYKSIGLMQSKQALTPKIEPNIKQVLKL